MDHPHLEYHHSRHPSERAQDKPGAGEIRSRALECYNNVQGEEAARQLLTLIELGKSSQWPEFRAA
eukprot:10131975-Heterocapsa_arctica.AAC.1